MEKLIVLLGMTIALVSNPAIGASIYFDDGETHSISESADNKIYLDSITANDPGTHLEFFGAANVHEIYTYNTSTVNMSGVRIIKFHGYDHSRLNVSNGQIYELYAYDNAEINISNGFIDQITGYGSATINFSNGNISLGLSARESSTITMTGGTAFIQALDDANINISGGNVRGSLVAIYNSSITLSGGTVENTIGVIFDGKIYLKGEGFEVDGKSLSNGDKLSDYGTYDGSMYRGTVTGTLEDGTPLNNPFGISNTGTYAGTADIIILTCGHDLAGDTNNDCKVDREDFKVIADDWLTDSSAFAPEIVWGSQIGTINSDGAYSVKLDDSGNVFICGSYSSGGHMFLAKHDSDGNLLWTEFLGTGFSNNKASDVAIDTSGNSFICGYTQESLYGSNAGSYDAVIAKYNPAGILQWVRQIGSQEIDMFEAISVDEVGNIYAAGYTGGDIGGNNFGQTDVFVTKYDTNGNLLWAKQFGSSSSDSGKYLKVAENGNIIIAGYSYGAIQGTNAVGRGVFTAEYDINGNLMSVKQFPLAKMESIWDFEIDSANNIYIGGYKWVDNQMDAILSKYTPNGNLLWSELLGMSSVADEIWTVTLDAQENVFVGGYTNGDLGGINQGPHDVFVAKYDSEGNFTWVSQIGSDGLEKCYSIVVDESGSIFMAGMTDGNLGGDPQGLFDAYLVKLEIHKYCDSFADTDGNCVIDFSDFATFATNWMVDCMAEPGNSACVLK